MRVCVCVCVRVHGVSVFRWYFLYTDPFIPAFERAPLYNQSIASNKPMRRRGKMRKQPKTTTKTQTEFPVIVFARGLGGMRTLHSDICCDLASHGYVVAAVEFYR